MCDLNRRDAEAGLTHWPDYTVIVGIKEEAVLMAQIQGELFGQEGCRRYVCVGPPTCCMVE
jgi:hypothetical protein